MMRTRMVPKNPAGSVLWHSAKSAGGAGMVDMAAVGTVMRPAIWLRTERRYPWYPSRANLSHYSVTS